MPRAGESRSPPGADPGEAIRKYDRHIYNTWRLAEEILAKSKQFHAIAIRYDKTARNVPAAIRLAAAVIWRNCRQGLG
jgi:transposase